MLFHVLFKCCLEVLNIAHQPINCWRLYFVEKSFYVQKTLNSWQNQQHFYTTSQVIDSKYLYELHFVVGSEICSFHETKKCDLVNKSNNWYCGNIYCLLWLNIKFHRKKHSYHMKNKNWHILGGKTLVVLQKPIWMSYSFAFLLGHRNYKPRRCVLLGRQLAVQASADTISLLNSSNCIMSVVARSCGLSITATKCGLWAQKSCPPLCARRRR